MKRTFAFIVVSIAVPAFAQSNSPSPQQQPPRAGETIVVTASQVPESAESTPAAVTVITRQDIDRRAARDVADVLREVPGLTLARSGSPGKQTSLFSRGAASTQTLVLWNGITLNNPYFSGYDWGRFSTAGVEQIEIVRGPYSALYGSEAMGGVVNVLTIPRTSGVHGDFEAGGNGLRNGAVSAAVAGQTLQASAAYERRRDDGFAANDDFSQNSGDVFVRWSPFAALSLGVAARHTSFDVGIPFNTNASGTQLVPSLERRQSGTETQFGVPATVTLGRFITDVTFSQNRRRDDFADPHDPFTTSTSTDARTRRARVTTRVATFAGTIVAGGEEARDTVSDVTNFGPNFVGRRRTARSLFAEDRWSHPIGPESSFELSAGVRRDRFSTFGAQTSPRVAAAFIAGASKVRAAWGRGFRAPSLGELYYPFFGNENLSAESNRSYEVGYDRASGENGLLSLTYFNARYRNLITFDPVTFVSANIGRVRSDGIEAGYQQHAGNAYTAVSYTWLHRNEDEATGQRLARRPKHSGSLTLGWRSGAADTTVTLLRTGAREDAMPVVPFGRITNAGYTTIDANVQYRMSRVTPFVKVENLRNARYDEVAGYAGPRRRVIVGLRF